MNSIRFLHIRHHRKTKEGDDAVSLKGGKTVAYHINDNHTVDFVVAKCGKHENYNRKRGATIAGGRLTCLRPSTHEKYVRTVEIPDGVPVIDTLLVLCGA